MKRIKVFLILFCLLLSALSTRALADNASASTIRLSKTEGTVNVKDAAGKDVFRQADMRLVSGNRTLTSERSYAWFALDDVKALKEDAVRPRSARTAKNSRSCFIHATSSSMSGNPSPTRRP